MKKSSINRFSEPQREAPNALIFIVLSNIWGLLRQLWVFILIYFFSSPDYDSLFFILLTVCISGIVLFGSIISYFRFSYYIIDNKLHIEKGVFRRSHINLPLERIQTINIEDNILHRFFGTVRVDFTTAGSVDQEFLIRSIDEAAARELKDWILSVKEQITPFEQNFKEDLQEQANPSHLLLQLGFPQLLKIGISQNHFRAIGLLLGAVLYLFSQIQELVQGDLFEWMYEGFGWTQRADLVLLVLLIVSIITIALMISMGGVFIRYWNLHVYIEKGRLRLKYGLIQQREQSAQIQKIQIFDWTDNPIRRMLDFVTVTLHQASSRNEYGGSDSIRVPGVEAIHRQALVEAIFPTIKIQPSAVRLHPSMVWRNTLFRAGIPIVIILAASWNLLGWWSGCFLLLLPISYGIHAYIYRNWVIEKDNRHIFIRRGFWSRRTSIIEWYKIQSVSFHQTPYQHRHGIGNLYMYTAAGHIVLPYLYAEDATQIMDYALYAAESSSRPWM